MLFPLEIYKLQRLYRDVELGYGVLGVGVHDIMSGGQTHQTSNYIVHNLGKKSSYFCIE